MNSGVRIMNKRNLLITEIEKVPEQYIDQVLDFVQFLKIKIIGEKINTAAISESSLRKDWLRPEEDEAWENL